MLFVVFSLASHSHAQSPLVTIDMVTVGDAGNAADTTGYGAVADVFAIGKYEVTIGQYTTFLNTVATEGLGGEPLPSYLYNLWSIDMARDGTVAGINRSGAGTKANPYSYSVIGSSNRPITFVNWLDAARFANWMHNGADSSGGRTMGTTSAFRGLDGFCPPRTSGIKRHTTKVAAQTPVIGTIPRKAIPRRATRSAGRPTKPTITTGFIP
jgi:hypothetical protein